MMPARNRPSWCAASPRPRRSRWWPRSRHRRRRRRRSTPSRSPRCCTCRRRFSADVLAGRTAQAQLLVDARRSNSALLAQGYAADIVAGYAPDLHPGHDAAGAADARLVQPDAGEHLVHPARPGLRAVDDHGAADQRAVAGARARARHVRAIAGHAVAPAGNPGRQGGARHHRRHDRRQHRYRPRRCCGSACRSAATRCCWRRCCCCTCSPASRIGLAISSLRAHPAAGDAGGVRDRLADDRAVRLRRAGGEHAAGRRVA